MERPVPCRITRDIVHLAYADRQQLCRAFMRPQEFYESPSERIRGRYFTTAQFRRYYAAEHDGAFTYCMDWDGFNLPGKVVREFHKVFGGRTTAAERGLLEAIAAAFPAWLRTDRYYVIGTVNGHRRGIKHELAHAFWYLEPAYRQAMQRLLRSEIARRAMQHMRQELLERGYANPSFAATAENRRFSCFIWPIRLIRADFGSK